MNTAMWRHPVTAKHLETLRGWSIDTSEQGWVKVLPPIEKVLACGDAGDGAMIGYMEVIDEIQRYFGKVERAT